MMTGGMAHSNTLLPSGAVATLALRNVCNDIMCVVTWDVEFTDEFFAWWTELSVEAQDSAIPRQAIPRVVRF